MKKISFGITINITLLLLVIRNMMISFLFKKMQFASAIIKLFKVIIIIISIHIYKRCVKCEIDRSR